VLHGANNNGGATHIANGGTPDPGNCIGGHSPDSSGTEVIIQQQPNWCPHLTCRTSLPDLPVPYTTRSSAQPSHDPVLKVNVETGDAALGDCEGRGIESAADESVGEGHRDDGGRASWSSVESQPAFGQGHPGTTSQSTFSQSATVSDDGREVPVAVTPRGSASDKEASPEVEHDPDATAGGLSQTAITSLSLSTWDWSAETTTKDWSASPPPPQELGMAEPFERSSPVACERPVRSDAVDGEQERDDGEQTDEAAETFRLLEELIRKNNYNPTRFDIRADGARFFVIKSYSEDDVHRSIKYSIWCSTERGNKKLDMAFREQQTRDGSSRPIYLFYSVNGSGHFCGMAQMTSTVDYNALTGVWAQDKWKGKFSVKWIYVKDIPNHEFRHIVLENNDGKPVTNSRDTQEIPENKGRLMLKILHLYRPQTSLFDDFLHYEKKQQKTEDERRQNDHSYHRSQGRDRSGPGGGGGGGGGRGFRDRERGPGVHHDDYRDHNGHHNHRDHSNANNRDFNSGGGSG
ncbi:hypothetical protein BIW11_04348, partial [Tropilaelaps mercedesae]